jgi:hypothetical protein
MARAHARPRMGRTPNRDWTSCRKDSRLMSRRIRPLLASVANSKRVISEIAKPSAFLARFVDCSPCLPGDLILVKRQPDHDMRINQNHLSSPHPMRRKTSPKSSLERAILLFRSGKELLDAPGVFARVSREFEGRRALFSLSFPGIAVILGSFCRFFPRSSVSVRR